MKDRPILDQLSEELDPKTAISSEKPGEAKTSVKEPETVVEATITEKVEDNMEIKDEIKPADPITVPRPSRGRGRPKVLSDEERRATQIFLTENERSLAKKIGKGRMSEGIRLALESYEL